MKTITRLFGFPLVWLFVVTTVSSAKGQTFLTSGLVAYYPFNGNANDASGGHHNGIVRGAQLTQDRFGNPNSAYYFNGNTAFISLPDSVAFKSQAYTITMWFAPERYPEQADFLISKGQNNFEMHTGSERNGESAMKFLPRFAQGADWHTPANTYRLNEWQQVTVTYNPRQNDMHFFINGSEKALSGPMTTPLTPDSQVPARLGMRTDGTLPFKGKLDDVRIFNRALSPNEVTQLFNVERSASSLEQLSANPNPATAEPSIPPVILSAASNLSPPTNEVAELSSVTGEVRVLDSKGLLIATNSVYLPRLQISDLSRGELLGLLENKAAYSTLTSFGNVRNRTGQSEQFENQMRQIWLNGKSLADKIQTRLIILDEIRAYNNAVASFNDSVRYAGQARANANSTDLQVATHSVNAAYAANRLDTANELRSYGFDGSRRAAYDAKKDLKESEKQLEKAQQSSDTAAMQLNAASQQVSAGANSASSHAARLGTIGIDVPSSPPFFQVPPLSMRLEVDAERVAGQ